MKHNIGNILIFMTISIILFFCDSKKWTKEETSDLFGKGFILKKIICKFNSERAFYGDGYSIYVFEIPDNLIEYVTNNLHDIEEKYPIKPDYRSSWTNVAWERTPFNEEEREFYDFAIVAEYLYFDRSSWIIRDAKKSISIFIELMNEEGNYYSYNYSQYRDIDFYVFSLKKRILICIIILNILKYILNEAPRPEGRGIWRAMYNLEEPRSYRNGLDCGVYYPSILCVAFI